MSAMTSKRIAELRSVAMRLCDECGTDFREDVVIECLDEIERLKTTAINLRDALQTLTGMKERVDLLKMRKVLEGNFLTHPDIKAALCGVDALLNCPEL